MSLIDLQLAALKAELSELREELRWSEDDHDHEREAELTELIDEIQEEIAELQGEETEDDDFEVDDFEEE